jgi:hypothetical protein
MRIIQYLEGTVHVYTYINDLSNIMSMKHVVVVTT